MTQTVPAIAVLGAGKTGLAIGLRVLNLDGTLYSAFATTDVAETATPGTYRKTDGVIAPDAGAYIIFGTLATDYAETVVDPASDATTPATTPAYASLAQLKAYLGITDTVDDDTLNAMLATAGAQIEAYCHRAFYQTTATRCFTARDATTCMIDDLTTLTTLATDDAGDRTYSGAWSSTEYDLCPYNAAPYNPYTKLQAIDSARAFPTRLRAVRVTALFGWPATPQPIITATIIQSARLFKRRDAPFGIAGSPTVGQFYAIAPIDPDVRALIDPYVALPDWTAPPIRWSYP